MISSLIVFVGLLGLVSASLAVSTVEVKESRRSIDKVRSKYLADAGLERGLHFLSDVVKKNTNDPLAGLNNMFLGSNTNHALHRPADDRRRESGGGLLGHDDSRESDRHEHHGRHRRHGLRAGRAFQSGPGSSARVVGGYLGHRAIGPRSEWSVRLRLLHQQLGLAVRQHDLLQR